MRYTLLFLWFALMLPPHTAADVIYVEHGRLTAVIDEQGKHPYNINGTRFVKATEAAAALQYIYTHWPDSSPPNLVYELNTITPPDDWQVFHDAIQHLSRLKNVHVVCLPAARGSIPESWFTANKLIEQQRKEKKKQAKKAGADQPAPTATEKIPTRIQPSNPTPEAPSR